MLHAAEGFFSTTLERGVSRPPNSQVAARVFLGMFTVVGFEQESMGDSLVSRDEMARGLTDIFLPGVLPASPSHV